MSEIRFSIETIYDDENNDDTLSFVRMGDFFRELDHYTALEALLFIRETIDNEILNGVIMDSIQEGELQRDTSNCISVISRKFQENKDSDNQCSICISKFVHEQDLVTLSCNHTFHKDCIQEWGHYKAECPLCKKSIPLVKENLTNNKDGMEQSNTNME